MKKAVTWILAAVLVLTMASCGTNPQNTDSTGTAPDVSSDVKPKDNQEKLEETPPSEAVPSENSEANILIAYFSRVGNTDFPDDVDAVSSASLLRKDGELYGNTQYIAALIQQQVGGDLFLIQTEEKYPADYDETDQQGQQENRD